MRLFVIIVSKFGLVKINIATGPSNRCLIISTTGIGDTLWGTPAIKTLKNTYPQMSISILTSKPGAELLMKNPYIDEILIFSNNLFKLLALVILLRKCRFDTVLIFHASDRIVWLLAYLTGASQIIGGDWLAKDKEMSFLLTKTVKLPAENIHAIDTRFLLINELGADNSTRKMDLYLTEEENVWGKTYLTEKGKSKGDFLVGLNPGAAKLYKCWPRESYIALGKALSNAIDCWIVITGNEDERHLATEIADEIGVAIPTAGDLNIRETAAIIKHCNIFITNDTGPMHMAFALGTPTLGLFSATDVYATGPHDQQSSCETIVKPKTCEICITKSCTNPVCMGQIMVDEVFDVVNNFHKAHSFTVV